MYVSEVNIFKSAECVDMVYKYKVTYFFEVSNRRMCKKKKKINIQGCFFYELWVLVLTRQIHLCWNAKFKKHKCTATAIVTTVYGSIKKYWAFCCQIVELNLTQGSSLDLKPNSSHLNSHINAFQHFHYRHRVHLFDPRKAHELLHLCF